MDIGRRILAILMHILMCFSLFLLCQEKSWFFYFSCSFLLAKTRIKYFCDITGRWASVCFSFFYLRIGYRRKDRKAKTIFKWRRYLSRASAIFLVNLYILYISRAWLRLVRSISNDLLLSENEKEEVKHTSELASWFENTSEHFHRYVRWRTFLFAFVGK